MHCSECVACVAVSVWRSAVGPLSPTHSCEPPSPPGTIIPTTPVPLLPSPTSPGTVSLSVAERDVTLYRDRIEERLEDGTLPFAALLSALPPGLSLVSRLTFDSISR